MNDPAADQESVRLLNRWRDGDESAASEIFQRYVDRLVGLARNRLSDKLRRRVDPEDVVQSAYRSFFCHAREDRYSLERSGDLWRLLAAITVNKLLMQARFHGAAKRDMDHEASLAAANSSLPGVPPEALTREPAPDEAAALVDQVESAMRPLKPLHRQIVELRLQSASVEEIAAEVGRTERTVRRVLEQVRASFQDRLVGSLTTAQFTAAAST